MMWHMRHIIQSKKIKTTQKTKTKLGMNIDVHIDRQMGEHKVLQREMWQCQAGAQDNK